MAHGNDDRSLTRRLQDAADGVPTTARGRLMQEAANALTAQAIELDRLRESLPPEGWVALDPTTGPAVFYLGLDGTLYRFDADRFASVPGVVDRAVALTLLRIARENVEEADRV